MPHHDKKLERLIRITNNGENPIVYAANLSFLSKVEIKEYEKCNVLIFRGYSADAPCNKCHKGTCTVPVKRVKYPDGQKKGVGMCPVPNQGGRLEFELEELKYWDINMEKLPKKRGIRECEAAPKISRKQKYVNDKTLLISALLNHHKFDATNNEQEGLNFEPAKQGVIGKQLNWSQSKVFRVMERSFPKSFWKRYILACKSDALKGFLKIMDDNQVDIEAIA